MVQSRTNLRRKSRMTRTNQHNIIKDYVDDWSYPHIIMFYDVDRSAPGLGAVCSDSYPCHVDLSKIDDGSLFDDFIV